MLAYSGGNHYDSVYSTQHMKNTAFCQGKSHARSVYSGTSLLQTPLGPQEVSWLEGCPVFFCSHVYVAGTMDSALIKEVSLFRRS